MGVLEGRAAAVTGGGRGIGRGHCLHLAQQGAAVVVNDIDPDAARAVADEIAEAGGRAAVNTSDISSREGAQALIGQCVDEYGAIHAMVNNAGNVHDRSFLKMSDEEFMSVVRVHQGGTFMCSQEAALRMRDQKSGGAIVNTVSAAHFGNFGQTNYAGSKGAIASMTYTWALELARYGIRVNAISPSGTTRMSATYKDAKGQEVEMPFIDPNPERRSGGFPVQRPCRGGQRPNFRDRQRSHRHPRTSPLWDRGPQGRRLVHRRSGREIRWLPEDQSRTHRDHEIPLPLSWRHQAAGRLNP